jgi:hypothetical protein
LRQARAKRDSRRDDDRARTGVPLDVLVGFSMAGTIARRGHDFESFAGVPQVGIRDRARASSRVPTAGNPDPAPRSFLKERAGDNRGLVSSRRESKTQRHDWMNVAGASDRGKDDIQGVRHALIMCRDFATTVA